MTNARSICATLFLAFALTACGGGPNIPDGIATLPTYSESEHLQDLEALEDSEAKMEELGMKFQSLESASSSDSVKSYKLELDPSIVFANADRESLTESREEELRQFIQATEKFLRKYTGNFNIQRPGQRRKVHSVDPDYLLELNEKLELCRKLLNDPAS